MDDFASSIEHLRVVCFLGLDLADGCGAGIWRARLRASCDSISCASGRFGPAQDCHAHLQVFHELLQHFAQALLAAIALMRIQISLLGDLAVVE